MKTANINPWEGTRGTMGTVLFLTRDRYMALGIGLLLLDGVGK